MKSIHKTYLWTPEINKTKSDKVKGKNVKCGVNKFGNLSHR